MTTKPFLERRTRSQIKLPDDILKVAQLSPMKNARNAARESSELQSHMEQVNDSEDELLLSPPKPSGTKRSVSPLPNDEYNTRAGEGTHGRELKRMKWDSENQEIKDPVNVRPTRPGHSRTNSEPNVGLSRKAQRKRAETASVNNKPDSTSDVKFTPAADVLAGAPGKARAQSVPLFPSSSSLPPLSSLPSLDLRNPPMSPIHSRSPSRATDRSHGLKVHPSPPKPMLSEQLSTVEVSHDESRTPMDVDHESKTHLIFETDTVMESVNERVASEATIQPAEDFRHLPEVSIQPPGSPALTVPLVNPPSCPPVTPAPSGLSFFASMSPLTPLPETPLPPRADDGGEDRYIAREGWGVGLEKEPEAGLSLHSMPQPNFGQPKNTLSTSTPSVLSRSQIPRPSMGPPPPLPTLIRPDSGETAQTLPKSAREGLNSFSSTLPIKNGSSSKSSAKLNAIELLMENASKHGASRQQDKGKSVSILPKVVNGTNGNAKGRGKVEPGPKKASLKDKMRRNQSKKAGAPSKFVPQVFDDDEVPEEKGTGTHALTPPASGAREHPLSLSIQAGAMTQDQSVVPSLPVQKASPLTGSSGVQELVSVAAGSIDAVQQLQPPSPISSMTSLSDTGPSSNIEHDYIASGPSVAEDHPTEKEEGITYTSTAVGPSSSHGTRQPKGILVIGTLAEPQTIEGLEQAEVPIPHPRPLEDILSVESPQDDKSKPASRKRRQSNIPTSTRVTRSAFKPPPAPTPPKPTRRPRSNSVMVGKFLPGSQKVSIGGGIVKEPDDPSFSRGSPMQTSSPIRKLRTPGSSPAKISLTKTPSKPSFLAEFLAEPAENSPSPTKIARAVSMFSRPTDIFATDDIEVKPNSSSLSTLSTALEKLKMPAPSRPNTSLGFNPDAGNDDEVVSSETVNRLVGLYRNDSLKHSFTVGHAGKNKPSSASSSNQTGPSTEKPRLVQRPVTMFFSKSGLLATSTSTANPRSTNQTLPGGVRPSLMGPDFKGKGKGLGSGLVFPTTNKRLAQKASRKTTLPTVEASPVKGGGSNTLSGNTRNDSIIVDNSTPTSSPGGLNESGAAENIFMIPLAKDTDEARVFENSSGEKSAEKGKDKVKEKSKPKDSSRQASMALSQLSQSLSAAPAYDAAIKGTMGPPMTPRKVVRSVSSTYPGPSNTVDGGSATGTVTTGAMTMTSGTSLDRASGSGGKRFSARQAAKATLNAETKSPSTSAGPSGSAGKGGVGKEKTSTKKIESLGVLKDCRIFVDVRTDDGEEAGSLFVEMLESLGAKIQTRVGQACTHVIFKNGLMSTISRYRLLRDPKPSAVGIAWVVECVEKRSRVEETSFLIDLGEMNVAGTNKRRRSMLPKLISSSLVDAVTTDAELEDTGDADVSMDGSQSSITLDDDLTPLERARRRRSTMFGPAV